MKLGLHGWDDEKVYYWTGEKEYCVSDDKDLLNTLERITAEYVNGDGKRRFVDVVLTYHNHLRFARLMPTDYAKKTIPLVQQAIDYFSGDLDNIAHLSGLERLPETVTNKDKHLVRKLEWEYFLIESYQLEEWEKLYRKNVRYVDRILKTRYKNRLPIKGIQKFYHQIDISSYMGGYAVDEISIGISPGWFKLKQGYWHFHLDIQARSTQGNQQECHRICQKLSELAGQYFTFNGTSHSISQEMF